MRVPRLLLFVAVAALPAQALMQAYSVEPVKAAWSGWTPIENNQVSQTVTCCWDTLSCPSGYVELFVGASEVGGANYNLQILDGTTPVAYQTGVLPEGDHRWLKFDSIQMEAGQSFTKGKAYEFRFTRSGSDSIQYYWDGDDPYKYGVINDDDPNAARDLCMRCYALLDPIDSTFWGIDIPSVC
jgi:hypothetical protein